jgi:WD40 repeat protein/serine/threonine protein kinase
MRLSAEQMASLSRLLDDVLDLEEADREAWLERLNEPFAEAKTLLREMLAKEPGGLERGLLDTLPQIHSLSQEADESVTSTYQAGVQIGNYRLVSELGHGGMGQVWLAEQVAPVHRWVALKLIRAGLYDATVAQRFQAERQSLAIMDHPAIAKVFDAGSTPQGQPYFAMEYVPGPPITDYCDQRKLTIRERIELFIQCCDGVQHAHQKAVIHRDLKPANILILEVDGKPVPRIIDFGIAKPTAPRMTGQTLYTQVGHFLGTPGYMSPEQVDPNIKDIDTRTDVYSLGAILYVLLVGMQPFETKGQPLDEWLRRLRTEEPPRWSAKLSAKTGAATAEARSCEPKEFARLLRGDLEWITMKALAVDRDRRYGTPSELSADLRRHLDDKPIVAYPPSKAYLLRKFVRRHRLGAAVTGVVALFAVAASIAGVIAVKQRRVAEFQTKQALNAESRLLTETASERLKSGDVAGAQGIILEVLTNRAFADVRPAAAVTVFKEIRAAESELAVLTGHRGWVTHAGYSPDGTRVVTASLDNTARVWDAATGALLAVLSGHTAGLSYAAYSPDGSRIVTASRDKTLRVWDARAGIPLAVLAGHGAAVYTAVFSPDGKRIVSASSDKTARVWDAVSGAPLIVLGGHGAIVTSAAFSPDGKRIVTASVDKTARIWDAATGAPVTVLSGHSDAIYSVAYSSDGAHIVTGSRDKTARIWDAHTGAQDFVLAGHREAVFLAEYSPDRSRVVTASADKTVRVWDAETGISLQTYAGHAGEIFSAAYSPDGKRIVTAAVDRTARIWNANLGDPLMTLSGHGDRVESASYSPDGSRIATASKDRTARIWNAATGAGLAVLAGQDNVLESIGYAPDGKHIITGGYGGTARIWDSITGASIIDLSGHNAAVYGVAYSRDGTRVVTASADKTARIWDAVTGAPLATLSGHDDTVYTAAFSPDGKRIVTGSLDKTARVWDANSAAQRLVLSGHRDDVTMVAYSHDGARIATASRDKVARVWDAMTGAPLIVLAGHEDAVHSVAFSPDDMRIVTASGDRTARIWDSHSGALMTVLSGHSDAIYSATYSPDGTRILTASADKTARVFDARDSAGLDAEITWSQSAQFDPLSDIERAELGLSPDPRPRIWPSTASACDQTAAAIHDPDRVAPGMPQTSINAAVANSACSGEIAKPANAKRLLYETGRVLLAMRDVKGARRQFELAVSQGYRAARIDLANLLESSSDMLDAKRAVSLYEQAWQSDVLLAAFELGRLYEHGVHRTDAASTFAIEPDLAKAWTWYENGMSAGEPNALARFAEREETNAVKEHKSSKNTLLLQAFAYYAAASECARRDDWPDEAWRNWRYRRATLARVLEHEGMIQQVADTYASIADRALRSSWCGNN